MVIILQIVFCLHACVQKELKQGQKVNIPNTNDRKCLQRQKYFHSYACCRFVFPTAAFSFPLQHAKNFWALETFSRKSKLVSRLG